VRGHCWSRSGWPTASTTARARCRALVLSPTLLLCDEPTGNLDRKAADRVASMLLDLHAAQQTILVLVTHSLDLARHFPVRLELVEGVLRPVA
jgi:lipoprotein-releasing system ATP-binding protein